MNTVLNYYLLPLKESHTISVQGYISGKISMDERELCVLVSNMVKNATEALQKIKDGYLWIKIREGEEFLYIIDIAKKNGGTYQIEIEGHVFKAEVYLRI